MTVGGGLTGCAIASRLGESNKKPEVILLEAGPDLSGNTATTDFLSGLSLLGGELDYAYPSEPVSDTANRVQPLNAGKVPGGGSILNFGGWLRTDAADYHQWAGAAGDKRWSYEGLKPWLTKTERYDDAQADGQRGLDGLMYFTAVSAAMGTVVDGEEKLLEFRGLRVADASIIPVPLSGHPQTALYAVAEQLADMMIRDF